MKTVACYHNTIPNSKSQEKVDVLKYFSQGIKACGDRVIDIHNQQVVDADVGFIQGWINQEPIIAPHLVLRKNVIKAQLRNNKYVATADSNLFKYALADNSPHFYLRYSLNGVFPNTGNYCDTKIDPSRWQQIKRDLNITVKDYRKTGNHILLCLQRNLGWSMGNIDIQDWANETINKIRQFSDRPIVIRAHPGDRQSNLILKPGHRQCKLLLGPTVKLSTNQSLIDDLKNCWAAVNYNSSPVVGAAIEGVPIFVLNKEQSQCAEISNDIKNMENPVLYDRTKWLERISMFHWKFSELRSGQCWAHMRKFID